MSAYKRRPASEVNIGGILIGDGHPVAVQSMTNTPTMDTAASVAQILRIAEAGADIVRLTAQTPAHSRNLGEIRKGVRAAGCTIPLVADIHFNPAAAFAAAEEVEKVRINPGNFVDPGRTFVKLEYTDEEYAAELQRIRDKFVPFLDLCRTRGVAIRIGVNHGSLSDRIMSRYGDTPAGMVESALEFLRICRDEDFKDVVISIKASNVVVMTETVRLLDRKMAEEGMCYPLHLGVTEAGDGEDARVKSAVGIGSLLADGIGDTIRVSLTEAPEHEIPVAQLLADYFAERPGEFAVRHPERYSPTEFRRRSRVAVPVVHDEPLDGFRILEAVSGNPTAELRAAILGLEQPDEPVVVKRRYDDASLETVAVKAAADLGVLLLDGLADGIWVDAPQHSAADIRKVELMILQAARARFSHTEYIACPSCGRTLYDIEKTLAEIKSRTSHLKNLKIGVMGCIVNGPGEMADADYGYVGAGPGRITLYKGREVIARNIPQEEALDRLIALIKEHGEWEETEHSEFRIQNS